MNMSNEAIIQGIDNKINELKAAISALEEAKRLLGGATRTTRKFYIASRTSGDGHILTVNEDKAVECDCEAGRVGRSCWARKGIERQLRYAKFSLFAPTGSFYDEKGYARYWKEVN
jgi:hypothetical protein